MVGLRVGHYSRPAGSSDVKGEVPFTPLLPAAGPRGDTPGVIFLTELCPAGYAVAGPSADLEAAMPDDATPELGDALARFAAGVPEARDELLLPTQRPLRRVASSTLRGGFARVEECEQTDDLMQTMVLRLLECLNATVTDDRGEPVTDAGVFLCRVSRLLREVLIDMARRHHGRVGGRPGVVSRDAADSSEVGAGVDPGTETLNPGPLASWTEFHTAVGDLPDNLRHVVELHWH